MRTIFCGLLSASLLAHAVFGCCRHDAEETHAQLAAANALALADVCCNEHGPNSHGNLPHEPCKDHPHCQGMCNYLPGQKSHVEKATSHASFDSAYDSPV